MKLREDVEAILQILNNSTMSPYLFQDNGSVINKNDIEHFVVVHARDISSWEKEVNKISNPPKKTRGRKKKVVEENEVSKYAEMESNEIEEEENLSKNEENVNLSDDDVYHLIAKQRKINIASTTILADNNWFICPVFKGMDGLYPLSFKRDNERKSYRINIIGVPIFELDPNTFNDENFKDWELNSMFMLNGLFEQNSANKLGLTAQTIFVHKKTSQLNYLIKKAMDRLKVTQRARIKLGNILIDEVLTYVGQDAYIANKENIARAIKRQTGEDDDKEITKYDLNDVKIIDKIVESYKKINEVAEKMEKTVPINREATFNNVLKVVVELEEQEHKEQALQYQQEEDVTYEEAYEATKTLRSSDYISSIITYTNTTTYMNMVAAENSSNSTLEKLVKQHELWSYFEGIKGVAHVSAGAIIADIDFRCTVHPSSVIRYLGLDNVSATPNRNPDEVMTDVEAVRIIRYLVNDYNNIINRSKNYTSLGIPKFDKNDIYVWEHFYKTDVIKTIADFDLIEKVYMYILSNGDINVNKTFNKFPTLKTWVTNIWNTLVIIDLMDADGNTIPTVKKRARQKYDTIITTYLDKYGKIKTKKSLGYNAELKAKLLQVMFDCMIKHKSPYYIQQVYAPYRKRLEQRFIMQGEDPQSKGFKDKIFKMARRFTIQRFLEDLWKYVRNYYNWPLNGGTYYEAKLGGSHRHGLNPAMHK